MGAFFVINRAGWLRYSSIYITICHWEPWLVCVKPAGRNDRLRYILWYI